MSDPKCQEAWARIRSASLALRRSRSEAERTAALDELSAAAGALNALVLQLEDSRSTDAHGRGGKISLTRA